MNDRPIHRNGKPSICFVSPNNYAVLSGRSDLGHIGGSEIQQPMIAGELLKRGHQVSFITLDHGQPDAIEHDGIPVFKMCSRSDGVPGLRFIHPRWTSLWSAMSRADADIYYQMNAGAETGQVAAWCQRRRRPFIFTIASDLDCDCELPYLRNRRERILYRYGLRRASRIIAQTHTQEEMFRESFGLDTVLIRSCSYDGFDAASMESKSQRAVRQRLLWVGRFAKVKRLDMLFEIARESPAYAFDVVGDGGTSPMAAKLREQAAKLPNVELHGRIEHAAIGPMYDRASLLVCTSEVEGYPNTFMEAWARGVPTVSTVDPDGVISINSLGAVAETAAGLKLAIDTLLESPSEWRGCAARARQFFLRHHRVDAACDKLEQMIHEVLHEC